MQSDTVVHDVIDLTYMGGKKKVLYIGHRLHQFLKIGNGHKT